MNLFMETFVPLRKYPCAALRELLEYLTRSSGGCTSLLFLIIIRIGTHTYTSGIFKGLMKEPHRYDCRDYGEVLE